MKWFFKRISNALSLEGRACITASVGTTSLHILIGSGPLFFGGNLGTGIGGLLRSLTGKPDRFLGIGHTLEAELGIPRNSDSKPDFDGWEVKAGLVTNFQNLATSKAVTVMTPEPDGGYYTSGGLEAFVRRYGYEDRMGREDRLNFGGVFRTGVRHALTGLTMQLSGFDIVSGQIIDASGAIELVDDKETVAASWSFSKLLKHWNGKHAQAAYIPAEGRADPFRSYRYGPRIRMGEGTDFLMLLRAFGAGAAYYDPGIKLEKVASSKPEGKKRSQFRIKSGDLSALYHRMDVVDLLS